MRIRGARRKLYLMLYDKPSVNKKALQFKRSMDEVKKLLGPSHKGKDANKK